MENVGAVFAECPASLDGGCFGEYGKGFLRFSYANSMTNLSEALNRIKAASPRWTAVAAD